MRERRQKTPGVDDIAVVGLWHLGTTITAAWLEMNRRVRAVDRDAAGVASLRRGVPPVYEPAIGEALCRGLDEGRLEITTDFATVHGCGFCFIAHDSALDRAGAPEIDQIMTDTVECATHLAPGSVIVLSAQVPVGTSRQLRDRIRAIDPSLELVYSPENLRLGEALACYLKPGHIVIGAVDAHATGAVAELFAPMGAKVFSMSLESSEMVKHALNAFLGTSVALANHWADLCAVTGADYADVALALRADSRVGPNAYLAPGVGFAGGTLGRDLTVLDRLNRERLGGSAPLFGDVLRYNEGRLEQLADNVSRVLPSDGTVCLLGATYKAGTSTLRRSLTFDLARRLLDRGHTVSAHDPRADWTEAPAPAGLVVAATPYDAARGADLVILMTEWPEYQDLDPARLAASARRAHLLDPKGFLRRREAEFRASGWDLSFSIWPPTGSPT